jgi:hypothetical protein
VWQLGPAVGQGAGAGPGGRSAGCVTAQPGPSFVCQDSTWVIAGTDGMTGSQPGAPSGTPRSGTTAAGTTSPGSRTASGSTLPASAGSPSTTCAQPAPGVDWTCQNGRWTAPGTTPPASATSGSGASGSAGCSGAPPLSPSGTPATCVDGRWVVP